MVLCKRLQHINLVLTLINYWTILRLASLLFLRNVPNDPVSSSGAGFSLKASDPVALVTAILKLYEMDEESLLQIDPKG